MKTKYLRTSDIAKAVGVHPNTVRVYEEWRFLPTIPRNKSGYRLFTEEHLNQMRLAHTILRWPYPGGKKLVVDLVWQAANGDFGGALENAYTYLARVKGEIAQAEIAAELLDRWASGIAIESTSTALSMTETAELLDVTKEALRNWERNGLIKIPRNPNNNYRRYGSQEIARLRVIRMLRHAGYSLMAILRMLLEFDQGQTENLRDVLDTPRPDEDIYHVTDQWLSTLTNVESRARQAIDILEEMIRNRQGKGEAS
jgi:DNA-binding transcriptional MerR regulator